MNDKYLHITLLLSFTAYFYSLGLIFLNETRFYQFNFSWLLLTFSYIFLFLTLTDWCKAYLKKSRKVQLLTLIVIAILLRFIFSLNRPVISVDIFHYCDYTKMLLQGMVPYKEAWIPYPTLFTLTIWVHGILFGTNYITLRTIFILCDVIVTVLIYFSAKKGFSEQNSFALALSYALCPLPLIDIAWLGHFDIFPTLLTLLAFIFIQKKSQWFSAIFLGLSTMLKIYPITVLPLFTQIQKTLKDKVFYIITFLVTAIIFLSPFLILARSEFVRQVSESHLTNPMNSLGFYAQNFSVNPAVISAMLFCAIGFTYGAYLVEDNKFANSQIAFLLSFLISLVFLTMGVFLVQFPYLFPDNIPQSWLNPSQPFYKPSFFYFIFGFLILFCGISFALYTIVAWLRKKLILDVSTCICFVIIFFIFSLTVFYGWYFIWVLPFALLIRDKRIKVLLLMACLVTYPTCYYVFDFPNIGVRGESAWSFEFNRQGNWTFNVYQWKEYLQEKKLGEIEESIDYGFNVTEDGFGDLWMKSRSQEANKEFVSYESERLNVTVNEYPLLIISGMKSGSDPTFGELQAIRISVDGLDDNGSNVLWANAFPQWTHLGNLSEVTFVCNLKANLSTDFGVVKMSIINLVRLTLVHYGDKAGQEIHLYFKSISIEKEPDFKESLLIFSDNFYTLPLLLIIALVVMRVFASSKRKEFNSGVYGRDNV